MDNETTRMSREYEEMKNRNLKTLILFPCGDFYELLYDDAETVSRELGITLTSRDKRDCVPMCAIPRHRVADDVAELIEKGYQIIQIEASPV